MLKNDFRRRLLEAHSEGELARWYDPLVLELDADRLVVNVVFPHAFFGEWFARSHRDAFETALGEFLGPGHGVAYHESKRANGYGGNGGNGGDGGSGAGMANSRGGSFTRSIDFPFGRRFTFESFLANVKNEFPVTTARRAVEARGETRDAAFSAFTPLVIAGEAGCGKTHLLRAMGNELAKRIPVENIFLGSVEELLDKLVAQPGFANSLEAMLVDDLQSIQREPEGQEAFTAAFNRLNDRGRPLIFACRGAPAGWSEVEPGLKSRLDGGLLVTLKRPDLEVRARYAQEFFKSRKIELDRTKVLDIARRCPDFRALQGALMKLLAFKEYARADLSEEDVERALRGMENVRQTNLTPGMVIAETAKAFNLTPKDLVGTSRLKDVAMARQTAMYLCRQMLGLSYPELGRVFGGRDHSTVLHACKKIEQNQKVKKDLKNLLMAVKKRCSSRDA